MFSNGSARRFDAIAAQVGTMNVTVCTRNVHPGSPWRHRAGDAGRHKWLYPSCVFLSRCAAKQKLVQMLHGCSDCQSTSSLHQLHRTRCARHRLLWSSHCAPAAAVALVRWHPEMACPSFRTEMPMRNHSSEGPFSSQRANSDPKELANAHSRNDVGRP